MRRDLESEKIGEMRLGATEMMEAAVLYGAGDLRVETVAVPSAGGRARWSLRWPRR